MSWGTATLATEPEWLPVRLLGLDRPQWPATTAARLARLREVAEWVAHAPVEVPEGSPVVGVADVHPATGAPSSRPARRDAPAWRIGTGGLRAGDVLVPASSSQPAVLIWEDCIGLTFAATFVVLRPDASLLLPEVLWAILNSSSGHAERRRRTELSAGSKSADVLDLIVPVPSQQDQQRIALAVVPLRRAARPTEAAVRQSWWKTATLRDEKNWSYLMSSKVPVDLTSGTPLGDLADISQGRKRFEVADRPAAAYVPLLRHRDVVRGSEPNSWVEPTAPLARSGDIVMSAINAASNAKTVDREHAVGAHLLIIHPRDEHNTDRILHALNGEQGRVARSALATGTTVVSLTLASTRRLPVGDVPTTAPPSTAPLDDTLERLVWK